MSTHYDNGNQRRIEKDGCEWLMYYGEFAHGMFIDYCCEIVAFGDTIEELEKIKKR